MPVMLVAIASVLFVACSPGVEPTEVSAADAAGDTAPAFELEVFGNENYTRGDTVSLAQFEGRPVVINFWYPSCPPCRLEMPDLESTFKKHRADGVEFIGVQLLGLDSAQEGQEFTEEFGLTYALGPDPDGSIVKAYDVIGFPTSVFLNSRHEVVSSWTGPLNAEKLEELVQEALQ